MRITLWQHPPAIRTLRLATESECVVEIDKVKRDRAQEDSTDRHRATALRVTEQHGWECYDGMLSVFRFRRIIEVVQCSGRTEEVRR